MYAAYSAHTTEGIRRRQQQKARLAELARRLEIELLSRELFPAIAALITWGGDNDNSENFERPPLADAPVVGRPYRPTVASIMQKICKATRYSVNDVKSQRRCRELVLIRQAVMYWSMRLTACSLPVIGKAIGGRDHTTVLSGKRAYVRKRAAMGRKLRVVR